jgi:hypothetical protein
VAGYEPLNIRFESSVLPMYYRSAISITLNLSYFAGKEFIKRGKYLWPPVDRIRRGIVGIGDEDVPGPGSEEVLGLVEAVEDGLELVDSEVGEGIDPDGERVESLLGLSVVLESKL